MCVCVCRRWGRASAAFDDTCCWFIIITSPSTCLALGSISSHQPLLQFPPHLPFSVPFIPPFIPPFFLSPHLLLFLPLPPLTSPWLPCLKVSLCLDETVALTRLAARLLIGVISSVACLGRKKTGERKRNGAGGGGRDEREGRG